MYTGEYPHKPHSDDPPACKGIWSSASLAGARITITVTVRATNTPYNQNNSHLRGELPQSSRCLLEAPPPRGSSLGRRGHWGSPARSRTGAWAVGARRGGPARARQRRLGSVGSAAGGLWVVCGPYPHHQFACLILHQLHTILSCMINALQSSLLLSSASPLHSILSLSSPLSRPFFSPPRRGREKSFERLRRSCTKFTP